MKEIKIPQISKVSKRSLVSSDKAESLTPELRDYIIAIAHEENVPVSGITLMGGRPYINSCGLDSKIKEKAKTLDWDFVGVEIQEIQRAGQEVKDRRAGFKATVIFFDKKGFQKAIEKCQVISEQVLDKLKEIFTHRFSDEGWASIDSIKMSTLHSVDNINHMSIRRATNRAKRQAVGCGLTSVDEMTDTQGITLDAEFTAENDKIKSGQIATINKLYKGENFSNDVLKKVNKEKIEDLTSEEGEQIIKILREAK